MSQILGTGRAPEDPGNKVTQEEESVNKAEAERLDLHQQLSQNSN